MYINKNIEIVDLALLYKDILIVTDTQIGYEESLNKQGVLIPRYQHTDIIKRLGKIIEITKPKTVLINGDIKHEFGKISETEWRHTLRLIDSITKRAKLILVKGNHDTILGPIANKKNIEILDHYLVDDIYFCHGHKLPEESDREFKKAKIVVIGHEHPAITLRDKGRAEKYRCFLKGKYRDKVLIVQPSFNLLTKGTDVTQNKFLSPFLKENIENFEVYVVDHEVLYFGKVKNLF